MRMKIGRDEQEERIIKEVSEILMNWNMRWVSWTKGKVEEGNIINEKGWWWSMDPLWTENSSRREIMREEWNSRKEGKMQRCIWTRKEWMDPKIYIKKKMWWCWNDEVCLLFASKDLKKGIKWKECNETKRERESEW